MFVKAGETVSERLDFIYILFERKWILENASVGDKVIKPTQYTIFNVTTNAFSLSDPFSLKEDIFSVFFYFHIDQQEVRRLYSINYTVLYRH